MDVGVFMRVERVRNSGIDNVPLGWRLILLITTIAISGPIFAQQPLIDDASIVVRVRSVVDTAMQRPEAVGLSVAVGHGDRVLLEAGFGLAELEHEVAANANTVFRVGSITKQFTAAAIMKLVENEKLGLDDNVSTYLPNLVAENRTITIRQLLNHSSGIPSYTSQQDFWIYGATRELTVEELLGFVEDVPFDFEPGSGWNYSNTGYYVLGPIIEQVDGRSYSQFLEEEFFQPLGLDNTRYDSNRDVIPNRAQGYSFDEETSKLLNDYLIGMANPGAAGGLLSTAGVLIRWQMALTTGDVVSVESYEQMITPAQIETAGPMSYGFGLSIRETEAGEIDLIQHGGGIHGFNSMLSWMPEPDLHVAILSNSEGLESSAIAREIFRSIVGTE